MKVFLHLGLLLLIFGTSAKAIDYDADVCVYGGTSGGVVAAVQAARMGRSVVLVEPGGHLGGMTSGGLSAVDIGDPRSVGGIATFRSIRTSSKVIHRVACFRWSTRVNRASQASPLPESWPIVSDCA